ncbi:hypothetical protein BJ742DRAFT_857539 [Cladochytrium replicatum]|nr:hypothetical protein BJ742DRAFT_857539 [Cladochytrium replicatum]
MSPFAKDGVNAAMADTSDLAAKPIEWIDKGTDLSLVVEDYEKEMFVRIQEGIQESANNLKLFFNSNSPKDMVTLFLPMCVPAAADDNDSSPMSIDAVAILFIMLPAPLDVQPKLPQLSLDFTKSFAVSWTLGRSGVLNGTERATSPAPK